MKRCAVAVPVLLLTLSAALRADVTVTNTMTITGPIAAMMGGATPTMVMRIKGSRARMDLAMMGQNMSTIIDIDAKTVTGLMHAQKTAQVKEITELSSGTSPAPQMPKLDGKVEPTGNTQEINGQLCSEYRSTMTVDIANFAAARPRASGTDSPAMPDGFAEMLKDLKIVMNGSMWVAKEGAGVAEYSAFARAAQKNMIPFSPLAGSGGMDDMMKTFSQFEGLTYLAEIDMTFEGTNPMIDMMKAMGPMKIVTKVTDISTEPIADDLFQIPADYTVTKQ